MLNSMNMYNFVLGDQGRIFFKVIMGDKLIEDYLIEDIEVCIDKFIRKTMSDGCIHYHSDIQAFSFILTQEDTIFLNPGHYYTQIRVKLKDFDNSGYNLIYSIESPLFDIIPGFCKEIL